MAKFFEKNKFPLDTPKAVLDYLAANNARYVSSGKNDGNISREQRNNTAVNGQNPYAVIITCSDSRVPLSTFSARVSGSCLSFELPAM